MKDALVTDMRTVCTLDPAIDPVRSDLEKFAATRDLSLVAMRPGMRATVYTLRPIGTQMMSTWVDAAVSYPEKFRRAFQVAVREIADMPHAQGAGVDPVWQPTQAMRTGAGEVIVWSEDAIDEIAQRVDLAPIYEIGSIAYERAFLGKALARGAASWSLPPSSRAVLDRMTSHRVAQILAAAQMDSAEKSPRSTDQSSEPSSAARGDATATASDGASDPPA